MKVIGVTGNIGSGKSTVAEFFAQHGAKIIDADEIVHKLLTPKTKIAQSLLAKFGKDIVKKGGLDRKKLAKICFSSAQRYQEICNIIHPELIKTIKTKLDNYRCGYTKCVVLDLPLLIESGLKEIVDVVVLVVAGAKQEIQRAAKKLSISESEVRSRRRFQLSLRDKLKFADFVIDNSKTLNNTERQVAEIWKKIMSEQI